MNNCNDLTARLIYLQVFELFEEIFYPVIIGEILLNVAR